MRLHAGNLGLTYAGLNKYDLAKVEYEKAILADPSFVEAHNNPGILLAQLGKTDAAITQFETALSIKPDFKPAAEDLGKIKVIQSKGR